MSNCRGWRHAVRNGEVLPGKTYKVKGSRVSGGYNVKVIKYILVVQEFPYGSGHCRFTADLFETPGALEQLAGVELGPVLWAVDASSWRELKSRLRVLPPLNIQDFDKINKQRSKDMAQHRVERILAQLRRKSGGVCSGSAGS